MPTFVVRQFHIPLHDAFMAQAIGLLAFIVAVPVTGALSDRYGRKPVMLAFLAPYALLIYPLFSWVQATPTLSTLLVVYVTLSVFLGGFFGPFSTALGEQFPTAVRSSGLAICYNIAVMVFGGFAQFTVTWLIESTGVTLAPVFYTLAGSVLGLIGCLLLIAPTQIRSGRTPLKTRTLTGARSV
ncbi:Proline/betaine transporter [compost metagenome]